MKDLIHTEIETPDGVAILEQIYVTELGFVMARIYYKKRKIRVNKILTNLSDLLEGRDIKVRQENFTNLKKIKKKRVYKTNYG